MRARVVIASALLAGLWAGLTVPGTGCRYKLDALGDAGVGGGDDAGGSDGSGSDSDDTPVEPRSLAVGNGFACAVRSGEVWCWGDGRGGQLGNGGADTDPPQPVPVHVVGISDAIAVTAGATHTCALRAEGQVLCWGANSSGQLGSDAGGTQRLPVPVVGLPGAATQIAAGSDHTCARLADATAWCWGANAHGQLGFDGEATEIPFRAFDDVVQVAAGDRHTCARRTDGSTWCWGDNGDGQLGNGDEIPHAIPMPVLGGLRAEAIALGGCSACALSDGRYYCWGDGELGQLGDGGVVDTTMPGDPSVLPRVTAIAIADDHGCAVSEGSVWCWGDGALGQLGNGQRDRRLSPVRAVADTEVAVIATGHALSCVMRKDGSVACWGAGTSGQLGNGTSGGWTPLAIDLAQPIAVATGAAHSCAIAGADKKVWCWGADDDFQLGDNRDVHQPVPVFTGVVGAVQLALGDTHSCALLDDGVVMCWGDGSDGELGDGQFNATSPPVQVEFPVTLTVAAIAAGSHFTCAATSDGAYCWGYNGDNELGDSAEDPQGRPIRVLGTPTGTTLIATGDSHACTATATSVFCWGDGESGQLGNGSASEDSPLVAVNQRIGSGSGSGSSWSPRHLAAGGDHTCAVDAANQLWCWGLNDDGELGFRAGNDQVNPLRIASLAATLGDVAASRVNTCAQTTAGPRCWGNNFFGQIGDGTTNGRGTPGAVQALAATALPIPGGSHTCAISGGQVQCWGDNSYGQLGRGGFSVAVTPVAVAFP